MSSLTLKRIVVFAASFALGGLITAFIVTVLLPTVPVHGGQPISIEKYGYQYFFWTMLPISLIFVVWLDYFLDTRILPD